MAGITLSELLKKMIEMGGSDLHLSTNSPPRIRVHGKLRPLDMPPLTRSPTASTPTCRSIGWRKISSSTSHSA